MIKPNMTQKMDYGHTYKKLFEVQNSFNKIQNYYKDRIEAQNLKNKQKKKVCFDRTKNKKIAFQKNDSEGSLGETPSVSSLTARLEQSPLNVTVRNFKDVTSLPLSPQP